MWAPVIAATVVVAFFAGGRDASDSAAELVVGPTTGSAPGQSSPGLNTPPPAAFPIPIPTPLSTRETIAAWAPVRRRESARASPSSSSPVVAQIALATPEGTRNVVLVLNAITVRGESWVRVRLATLPNGRIGWLPRAALGGYEFVHTRLVVSLRRLTITLFRDGRSIFRAPIGVGTPEAPTPTGDFYIRDELRDYGSAFYGPVAFGTSARSAVLTDWPAGGFIGIHGTSQPGLIPGRVSHGCIRMRNRDILRLAHLVAVGTPITIR